MAMISWILLNIEQPQLTGDDRGGLALISATLSIAETNASDAFQLVDNELQVWAPRGTPVQISWNAPTEALPNGVLLTNFLGLQLVAQEDGELTPMVEFPTTIITNNGFFNPELEEGLTLSIPSGPVLTTVDENIAESGATPPFSYEYTIVFQGSDGNVYLLDPGVKNER